MVKVIFFGSGSFPVPILKELIRSKQIEIIAIFTSPHIDEYDMLYQVGKKARVKIYQPTELSQKENTMLEDLKPDILLVCNYGQFLPSDMLSTPQYGSLNIHCSLLPKLRGACPIEMAILKGYKNTGVTIQVMEPTMDTGDIIYQKKLSISNNDTGGLLAKKMQDIIKNDIVHTIDDYTKGRLSMKKQDHTEATYCYKKDISKEAAKIDWNKKASEIERAIRAFNPRPTAWTYINIKNSKKRLKIFNAKIVKKVFSKNIPETEIKNGVLSVQTRDYILKPEIVQLEGKSKMHIHDFIRGYKEKDIILS